MRRAIYIASVEGFSGKSILTISLAQIAMGRGLQISYFKPVSTGCTFGPGGELVDEDTETMKEILGSGVVTCSIKLSSNFLEYADNDSKAVERILESYKVISSDKDIVLIEGSSTLSSGSLCGCQVPRLASILGAELLLVVKYIDDSTIDQILQ
ncbi:MAG: dethiobiotin synthase, partial [Crenarchaeota archaeon]|nr:dethiobiotin synthase [Thermoproteota archaeon]